MLFLHSLTLVAGLVQASIPNRQSPDQIPIASTVASSDSSLEPSLSQHKTKKPAPRKLQGRFLHITGMLFQGNGSLDLFSAFGLTRLLINQIQTFILTPSTELILPPAPHVTAIGVTLVLWAPRSPSVIHPSQSSMQPSSGSRTTSKTKLTLSSGQAIQLGMTMTNIFPGRKHRW